MTQIDGIRKRLVQARQQAGLSQAQVAKMLGLARTSITNTESGDQQIDLERFLQFCEIYSVDQCWLLTGVNPHFEARQTEFLNLMANARISFEDSMKLLDTLESLAMKPETDTDNDR